MEPENDFKDWLNNPKVKKMLDAFGEHRYTLMFYGGCVRDIQQHKNPNDFDIVTSLPTQEVIELLAKSGIEMKMTHPYFESLKTNIEGLSFDIHSFHSPAFKRQYDPNESFMENVRRFVGRVDLTINTVICNADGQLFNQFTGREDLKNGLIRFTRNPERIDTKLDNSINLLRFYRFFAWYAKQEPTPEDLESLRKGAKQTARVPPKRKFSSMHKMLAAPDPCRAVELLEETGTFPYTFGFKLRSTAALRRLVELEKAAKWPTGWHVRLALLLLCANLPYEEALRKLLLLWEVPANTQGWLEQFGRIHVVRHKQVKRTVGIAGMITFDDLMLVDWALDDHWQHTKDYYLPRLRSEAHVPAHLPADSTSSEDSADTFSSSA